MKFTQYFQYTRNRPDRIEIKLEWIQSVIENPVHTEIQSDKRIKMWGKIPEAGNKYLRVILLEDKLTVHNAFFDRSFKENKNAY